MVCDTPSSQDASTHKIWNSYLKEYRRYAPDTKRDGRTGQTDGRTVRLLYASQKSFGGIKIYEYHIKDESISPDSLKLFCLDIGLQSISPDSFKLFLYGLSIYGYVPIEVHCGNKCETFASQLLQDKTFEYSLNTVLDHKNA